MDIRSRIGIDCGRQMAIEDALAWAARHRISYLEVEIDHAPNALESFTTNRCRPLRATLDTHGIHLGLHTLSAVNIGETSPFVRDAVDRYLEGYVDAAERLGAEWIVVHAGYHFGADKARRMEAGRERLRRAAAYAEKKRMRLLLENLNKEPDAAEVHYLAHDLAEFSYYFEALDSPALGLSFTVNHAHLVPEGIDGFLDVLPIVRVGEVRLADNLGDREVHLKPGDGNIDFAKLFRRLEDAGFSGHYMSNFGSLDDMLAGRDVLAAIAERSLGRAVTTGLDNEQN
ncbi:MAG TPA: sugar phosphate isomerase/epimerase family protein [Casimicrobiaceae bacterium]|nr:sugar phosphate isomerase/epimerase family protein [Casimicrobiaceae bacterium]